MLIAERMAAVATKMQNAKDVKSQSKYAKELAQIIDIFVFQSPGELDGIPSELVTFADYSAIVFQLDTTGMVLIVVPDYRRQPALMSALRQSPELLR